MYSNLAYFRREKQKLKSKDFLPLQKSKYKHQPHPQTVFYIPLMTSQKMLNLLLCIMPYNCTKLHETDQKKIRGGVGVTGWGWA